MAIRDYKDIYIKYEGHPKYSSEYIIEDDVINVIIQKLEMILFSRKGEVLGDPDMGCDIEFYLWKTKVPAKQIKKIITDQIVIYIPELTQLEYDINIEIYEGTIQDIMYITTTIKDYNVKFIFQ
jgi:hypothetical protein